MRVLFSIQPATGHLQPLAPIGHALQERGHEVAVACSPAFCPVVEGFGFRTIPMGLDWLRAEAEKYFPQLCAIPPQERYAWILGHIYAEQAVKRLMPELLDLCGVWRPDVVIRDQMEFASWLVSEKLGIPHVSYGYGLGFQEADRVLVRPHLQQLLLEAGLPPDDGLKTLFRHLRIELAPRSYLGNGAGNGTTHHIRPQPRDCPPGTLPQGWLATLGRRPVVVASLGNNYNRTPGIFEAIIAALADEPLDLVLTIGRNRQRAEFGHLPANVRIEQYVPLSLLLPRADLTICHAGFNTIFTAVAAGTPLLLIPIDSDQPAGAQRCTDLGLGPTLDRRNLQPVLVRNAVYATLRNGRHREAVAALRREMEALPDAGHAAELLELLAGSRVCGATRKK